METYLLKTSLALIILYGFYWLTLRFEFNHQLNRFIGLTCILFSIGFPFIEFKVPHYNQFPKPLYVVAASTADFQETVSSAAASSTVSTIILLYAIGASILLLLCVYGLATLLWLCLTSQKSYQNGFTIVTIDRTISPFTFFNVLFVGNNRIERSEMETMMLHEQVHRDQYHSIDAVMLEVLTVVFWFNPAIWLFGRDIKAQHEYYADQRVLEKGINPVDYQLLLFKAQTGTSMELGNYFSNSRDLMKRFNMMTKRKPKSKDRYLRVSLLVVLMSVILFLSAFFSRNEDTQIDKVATYEQGEQAMYQTISQRIIYPSSARRENRSGVVHVSFTVTEDGDVVNIRAGKETAGSLLNEIVVVGWSNSLEDAKGIDDVLKAAAVRAVEGLGEFLPAQKNSKPVSSVLTLPVKFNLTQK